MSTERYYCVIGKAPGDDEYSAVTAKFKSEGGAVKDFKKFIRDQYDKPDKPRMDEIDIIYVVSSSAPIQFERTPLGY